MEKSDNSRPELISQQKEMNMRDTIFISHSNPEDNDFTLWLATRLQLAGYKVWCDQIELIGGEKHWDDIQYILDNKAAKFILVESNTTFSKEGVLDEFDHAKTIAKQYELKDFIIPIRIEDTPFNARIGLSRYNHIDAIGLWAKGLQQLIDKLKKDNAAIRSDKDSFLLPRFTNKYILENGIIKKKEIYYSNLWKINKLPKSLYLFKFDDESKASTVLEASKEYPVVRHGNILVSFNNSMNLDLSINSNGLLKDSRITIKPTSILKLSTQEVIKGYRRDDFPNCSDARNLLKMLLNYAFHLLMEKNGLHYYEMSSGKLCYYFRLNTIPKNKVKITYSIKFTRTKNLIGSHLGGHWHFGITSMTKLFPFLCYSLRSHILFSDDGFEIWQDPKKLHSERRKKGRRWFNEEWRDQLMAFIAALKPEKGPIRLPLNTDFSLSMQLHTHKFNSDFGYKQPQLKDREDILMTHGDELEYYEELDEDTAEL
jgi:hypothetical protein